jgi:hypothetical protein
MVFRSELSEESGIVRLYWTSTDQWTGETRQCENRITLMTSPQPFGGWKWLFVCPRTGKNAAKLYLPSGAYTFACRRAYQLGYRSQRETPRDRSLSRAFALRRKILVASGTLNVVVPGGVRAEVQNPHTPIDVQDAVLPRIFNRQPGLNTSEQEARRHVALILRGSARPGKHAADASHLSEAAETACAYTQTR